ncbi:hypothetical protein TNCV_3395051 [Trichonephila clavipes]|nr:hypothetical protein TNCV_3395051 [Trichonephila clavipes]
MWDSYNIEKSVKERGISLEVMPFSALVMHGRIQMLEVRFRSAIQRALWLLHATFELANGAFVKVGSKHSNLIICD